MTDNGVYVNKILAENQFSKEREIKTLETKWKFSNWNRLEKGKKKIESGNLSRTGKNKQKLKNIFRIEEETG